MTKIRRSINIDKEIWETLPQYINTSRSAWIEEQAKKIINQLDDIEEIESEIRSIENQESNLKLKKQNLEARKEEILRQRETNQKNTEIKEHAMSIIRTVVENEGGITEKRIIFIAKNHYLDSEVVLEMVRQENLRII